MALEGLLQEFGLADILQLIYFQKKTGILSIEARTDTIELSFINGNITGLKSQRRLESNRLGRILMKRGLINQDSLQAALEMQKTEGVKIGNYFARNNQVSRDILMEIIQEQIIEVIVQVFNWKEGRYEFRAQGIPVDKDLPVYIDTQHLLMDGLRIVDEWTLVEGKLDLNAFYKRTSEPVPEDMSEIERDVLLLVDGERDVMAVIHASDSGEFETAQTLVALYEKGFIEPFTVKPLESKVDAAGERLSFSFYGVVVGIMVIVFAFLIKGSYDSFQGFTGAKTSYSIEKVKNTIDIYSAEHGHYPRDIHDLAVNSEDPWDRTYVYRLSESGYVLFSAGPDGVEGTEDDVY